VHDAALASDQESGAREILRRVRGGDRGALGGLIDLYGESLMHYLTTILGNRETAEDAFQDTWVRVVRRIDRFDPGRPFGPWLFRIARNRAFDQLRYGRRWLFFRMREGGPADRPSPTSAPAARASTASHPAPREAIDQIAARQLAERLIAGLTAGHREVIWLRFYDDRSYEEMAAICGVRLGTIKSRLRRALDRLALLYARLGATPATGPERRQGPGGSE